MTQVNINYHLNSLGVFNFVSQLGSREDSQCSICQMCFYELKYGNSILIYINVSRQRKHGSSSHLGHPAGVDSRHSYDTDAVLQLTKCTDSKHRLKLDDSLPRSYLKGDYAPLSCVHFHSSSKRNN